MNWLTSRCAPLMALTALALTSCDKGTDLNVDLPDTTAISTEYRDLDVEAGTVRLAPVQTLKNDHFLVGRLIDNVAGTTETWSYLNVVTGPGVNGGGSTDSLPSKLIRPLLDSVVLVLGFDQVYGSATAPLAFDVYKLLAPLDERQVYNSGTAMPLGTALGQNLTSRLDRTRQVVTTAATTTTPAVIATVPDQTVRLLLQRRAFAAVPPSGTKPGQAAIAAIPLPFATDLFTQLSQPNFGQAQLDAALQGLAVVPSASHNGSIVSFGRNYDSRMTVYFHADATRPDTLRRTYSLYFGPVFSSHNLPAARDPRYYTQIISTLPPALAALSATSGFVPAAALSGTSYVQEGTGLGTRVKFLGLDGLLNTPGLIVNRAELRVPIKPFTNALFPNPSQLYAVEVDGNNDVLSRTTNFTVADRVVQADGRNQLGTGAPAVGALTDVTTSLAYYSLPITNYLQAYINDKLESRPAALVLVPSIRASNNLFLNRAALNASGIKLRVYYSKR